MSHLPRGQCILKLCYFRASDLLSFVFMLATHAIYGQFFCCHCRMKLVRMVLAISQN